MTESDEVRAGEPSEGLEADQVPDPDVLEAGDPAAVQLADTVLDPVVGGYLRPYPPGVVPLDPHGVTDPPLFIE